ncbi:hypothetical protein ASG32_26635 [Methylobacterium sp. Leaf361]|uniref:hypothetical protein n=1 Tax=Methylobacterium sp. Leaf361 TaxID=1736352 RepID=UPI0006F26AFF|nr:hypothetical protein [Methylobacterium sp. Leaf361]KQS76739.1 hypothetical protein ASG32_26635 [Methylobacterium sp. Leaf361]
MPIVGKLISPALMVTVLTGTVASADEAPRYDIEAICRGVPNLIPGTNADKSCIADETQARTQVAQQWSGFDEKRRRECLAENQIGGPPSYVALLSCLKP